MSRIATTSRSPQELSASPISPVPPGQDVSAGTGGGNQLTRVTVNLTPRAVAALERLSANGGTKTELINRALQILELVEQMIEQDGGSLTVKHPDGTEDRLYIF
ncbi:hypothetical protein [Micromonospora sp. NPDC004704]